MVDFELIVQFSEILEVLDCNAKVIELLLHAHIAFSKFFDHLLSAECCFELLAKIIRSGFARQQFLFSIIKLFAERLELLHLGLKLLDLFPELTLTILGQVAQSKKSVSQTVVLLFHLQPSSTCALLRTHLLAELGVFFPEDLNFQLQLLLVRPESIELSL